MSSIRIATWNVNSIRTRLHQLLPWLKESSPDIVLLQELKCMNDQFPYMEIEELGYNIKAHGQKTYNGVAILSKFPLDDVITTLPGEDSDQESRYIEAVVSLKNTALRVASIYVPNGMSPESQKFAYKLRFLERLEAHARTLLAQEEVLVLGGDYNVAPFPIDVYAPKALDGTVCYHPEERKRLRTLLHMGLYDAYRLRYPQTQSFSWWDYRSSGFESGKGMRIDHLLISAQAADKLVECSIESALRGQERPSDHVPVVAELNIMG